MAETATINVGGMTCMHCVQAVIDTVKALNGVENVQVSLEAGSATVDFNAELISLDAIKTAIADDGFEVSS